MIQRRLIHARYMADTNIHWIISLLDSNIITTYIPPHTRIYIVVYNNLSRIYSYVYLIQGKPNTYIRIFFVYALTRSTPIISSHNYLYL